MKRSRLSLAIVAITGNPQPNLYQCRYAVLNRTKTIKKTSALGWTEFLIRPQS